MNKKLLFVVDLEALCWDIPDQPGEGGKAMVEPRSEIIEIGAILLPLPSLNWTDRPAAPEFQAFVRPKNERILSDFCKNLTHIRQEDVDTALSFPEVNTKMFAWMTQFGMMEDIMFGSWGRYDRNQMVLDCELNQVPYMFDESHLNIKTYCCHKLQTGKVRGLGRVLKKIGMAFEGVPHRALTDAKMTAKILQKVGYDESTAIKEGITYRAGPQP